MMELYIADRVFEDMPRLTGLDLVRHGRVWWGACRMNGEQHPRKDKLKVYIWSGRVYLHEEGGDTLPVDKWMVQYGGVSEKKVWRILKGDGSYWAPEMRKERVDECVEVKYVSEDVLRGAQGFPLESCSLFRWMAGLFGADRVREVWNRYGVTTDTWGRAVFWYIDKEGKILHDKRISYGEDGHRKKDRPMTRQYKVDEGYAGRCLFGENVKRPTPDTEICVVESEKTALIMACWDPGRKWVATGGKGYIGLVEEGMILFPDMDAVDRWKKTGLEVCEWWQGWEGAGRTSDVADMVIDDLKKGEEILEKFEKKLNIHKK